MIDPIWWFYLFWVPDFLQRQHGLRLIQIGLPILVIYVIADVGSVAGGWLSSSLTNRGVSVDAGRKIAMLVCAVSVVPIAFAHRVSGLWLAVLLIGLAAAGHQGFSANLFTLTSDLFPSRAVASVVGIGGMAGALGGMLIAEIVGYVLQWSGTYRGPFLIVASAYLVALALIHQNSHQPSFPKRQSISLEAFQLGGKNALVTGSSKGLGAAIAANLTAISRLSQFAAQQIFKQGTKGKLLNIASLLSFQGGILVPPYAGAKGDVAQLTKAMG